MTKKGYVGITFQEKTVAGFLTANYQCHSAAGYLTGLVADGMRRRLLRQGFRPPKELIETLLPDQLAVLVARWQDATEAACGVKTGALGNRYKFVQVPEGSQYYEPGANTAVPLPAMAAKLADPVIFDAYARVWRWTDEDLQWIGLERSKNEK